MSEYVIDYASETMLRKIEITPLAEESLGVRSMCTFVETPDIRILLDAGVSLGPFRLGFPPHPQEYKALKAARKRIAQAAEKADVVTISHYHFDHHTPSYTDWFQNWSSDEVARQIYEGKIVLAKSYRDNVNFSQRHRGWVFANTGGKYTERFEFADGKEFVFGETQVRFSQPVIHGEPGSELGWLIMTTIKHDDERALFTSDVQGPMHSPTLNVILNEKPEVAIIGGPPAYLSGLVQEESIKLGLQNLEEIAKNVPATILEHHLLRQDNWRELAKPIFESAKEVHHTVYTAAEFLKKEDDLLESRRKLLYEKEPPNNEFKKWTRMPIEKRKKTPPPI
jgi:predicted metallo-beta-lactamase superfamily hydrolase